MSSRDLHDSYDTRAQSKKRHHLPKSSSRHSTFNDYKIIKYWICNKALRCHLPENYFEKYKNICLQCEWKLLRCNIFVQCPTCITVFVLWLDCTSTSWVLIYGTNHDEGDWKLEGVQTKLVFPETSCVCNREVSVRKPTLPWIHFILISFFF